MDDIRALVLAAGKGSRMKTEEHKQFLPYRGMPLFLWSVRAFLDAGIPVTVVTGEEDVEQAEKCLHEFASEPGNALFDAVDVIPGGAERWASSYNGLKYLSEKDGCEFVLIHDAARPFVTQEVIRRAVSTVREYGSAVASVPSKDTVKLADEDGFVESTPDRARVYMIQTPQGFYLEEILEAYERMIWAENPPYSVTDDSSVMERYGIRKSRLFEADYANIKITTPEDLVYLQEKGTTC